MTIHRKDRLRARWTSFGSKNWYPWNQQEPLRPTWLMSGKGMLPANYFFSIINISGSFVLTPSIQLFIALLLLNFLKRAIGSGSFALLPWALASWRTWNVVHSSDFWDLWCNDHWLGCGQFQSISGILYRVQPYPLTLNLWMHQCSQISEWRRKISISVTWPHLSILSVHRGLPASW